jgi:hypothetical protein
LSVRFHRYLCCAKLRKGRAERSEQNPVRSERSKRAPPLCSARSLLDRPANRRTASSLSSFSYPTTAYAIFGRMVRSRNVNISLSGTPTASWNAASSLGGNVAVRYNTYTPLPAISFNRRTFSRHRSVDSRIMWHSSITIRSS